MHVTTSSNGTITATAGAAQQRAPHESAGTWAPDGWRQPRDASLPEITFFRMDTAAVAAVSKAFANGGALIYGDPMIAGHVAVYGVIALEHSSSPLVDVSRRHTATMYQVAIHRDAAGDVKAAYDVVVGPMNVPAPLVIQDAFQAFLASF